MKPLFYRFCIKCKEQENKGDPICSSTSNNTVDLEPFSNNGKHFATKSSICRSIIEDRRCFPEETEHSIVDRVFQRMISTPPKAFKMNNSGRRSICKLVPKNHFGPIPGVEVGTCWKYRTQVSKENILAVLTFSYVSFKLSTSCDFLGVRSRCASTYCSWHSWS